MAQVLTAFVNASFQKPMRPPKAVVQKLLLKCKKIYFDLHLNKKSFLHLN